MVVGRVVEVPRDSVGTVLLLQGLIQEIDAMLISIMLSIVLLFSLVFTE